MYMKVALVVCAIFVAHCFAVDCKPVIAYADGTMYQYDLTKLSHAAGMKDSLSYRLTDGSGSYIFMNVCGPSSEPCKTGSSVCLRDKNFEYESLGMLDTQQVQAAPGVEAGQGIEISYSQGDECIVGAYEADVLLLCDPSLEGDIVSADPGECWYKITVSSKYACGKQVDSMSPASSDDSGAKGSGEIVSIVILVLLGVGVVAYFGLGVWYQKKYKDASTIREHIIHNEFWCSIPGLVKDGVLFIAHGFKKGDYVSL